MKRALIAAMALVGCSTPAVPLLADGDPTSAGILFGIEMCHRHVIDGVPLQKALSEGARGRTYERDDRYDVVSGISPPGWRLGGDVMIGATDRGGCNIHVTAGDGPAERELVLATHFGMSSRRWTSMQIIAAPRGEIRNALCTVDRMPEGKSAGIVITSRAERTLPGDRSLTATVMLADAASCTTRQFP